MSEYQEVLSREMRFEAGRKVYSRTYDEVGLTTGSTHACPMSGCSGLRVAVKWPDGRHTFPCSRGMALRQIIGKESAFIEWRLL